MLNDDLLELKFKMLYDKIESDNENNRLILNEIKANVESIFEQVKKTNGRVTELERWRYQHEIDSQNELMEYKFLKKYPKMTIIICYILRLKQSDGKYKTTAWIFPEAFEVLKTLPSLQPA